ncbi:MFS transporter [Companilactobacillus nuruki]|uniref:MFS transporter n=1 Tax=Companilactobacillus nuruki TaxID=1993540 RepID=A0A2N7AR71_9LACO|nr:MFS transporter [Companilactobacillus nuruki]PMD67855.1 MFS transporter [Companilactobacillus nuruki]
MRQPPLKTTISILSLSTVSGITTVITGILTQLKQSFPTVPTTIIEWIVTIANFSALLTLMFNSSLVKKFGVRKIVISGLILSSIMGIIPVFTSNLWLIMLSRIFLGLGIGLFSPHAISLIAHTYHGELRARLLGYQTGFSALGNAVLLGLAGLLIGLNWHAVFWLHIILLIVALLIYFFVPEPNNEIDEIKTEIVKLPRRQWKMIFLTFVTYLLIWGIQLKLPSYFESRNFGNAQILNLTLSAMNIGGLIAGLTFGYLHKYLHRYVLTLGYIGAALSVLLLYLTKNPNIAIGSAVFFNFIYSYTGPYLIFTSNKGLKSSQVNTLSSYITISTIISAFFAPLIWNLLGQLGPSTLPDNVFLWIILILILLTILTIISKTQKGSTINDTK